MLLSEKNINDNLFIENLEEFNLEGKIISPNQIEKNQEIEILKENKLYNELIIERVEDIDLYTDIKDIINNFDIEIGDDIFYDELPKPEMEIEKLEEFSFINENYFKDGKIEKAEELEIIPEKKFIDFEIENNDCFIIEKENSINKEFEYNYDSMKKNNDNYFTPEKLSIIDSANFQIISIGIRELYQQKLQGFSIIKKEKDPNEIDNYKENFQKNEQNILDNNSYYNKNINTYNIQKNRIMKINKNYYDYDYNNDNIRKINTYKSQNYKTFIAFPTGNLECIDNLEISNGNIKINNGNFLEEKNNLFHYNNKTEINKNKNKNFLDINHNNLNNSFSNKYKSLPYNEINKYYTQSTPTKDENNQNKNDFKTLTEQRIYKRRIYRKEENKTSKKNN